MREFLRLYFGTPRFEHLPLFNDVSLVNQYFSAKHLKEALRASADSHANQAFDTITYLIACPAENVIAAQMHALNALNEMPARVKRRVMRDYRRRTHLHSPAAVGQSVAAE